MPPKAPAKNAKVATKIAEDKTFGLKNKNKSKAVQKYIKQITNNVSGAPKGGKEEQERKEKEKKDADIQKKALLNSLFNMQTDKRGRAYDPVAKKAAKQAEEDAIAAGKKLKDELKKEIVEGIANSIRLTNSKGVRMSELGGHPIITALKTKHADTFKNLSMLLFIKANDKVFWVDDPDNNNPMIRMMEDVEAEVAPDERPIEEILEEKRAALPPGGTPVTLETFQAWREKKKAEKAAQEEEERQKVIKKGAKGAVGLSGRDLFTYDATLFVDDDEAAEADDLNERTSVHDEDEEKPVEEDDDEEEADEDGDDAQGDGGARGSGEPTEGVEINKDLFLQEGDVPDDLDDLDDDEEEGK